jgi:hypothetical protein
MNEQATKLFVDTIFVASASSPTKPVTIIIDALDETDLQRLNDTVKIFSRVVVDLPRNAKVVISSRADTVILDHFAHLNNPRVRHLHLSAEMSISEATRFLERKVKEIMKEYRIDFSRWSPERMRKFCAQASGLFIWAVTAIKYIQVRTEIEDSGKECLEVVLDELNARGMQDINTLYLDPEASL